MQRRNRIGGLTEMTLLRRHGLWLVLATIAGIVGAMLMYTSRSITYSSTAQVDVEAHVVANTTPVTPNMTTETQVATSGVVVTSTAHALRLNPPQLQSHLSAKVSGTANILSITCTMPTRPAAQRCATAAAAAYIAFRNMASANKTAQAHDPLQATLVTAASAPGSPAGLGKKILLPLGAILGLLVGVGAMILRDRADDRVRDRADVERCLEAPVIAEVPRVSRRGGSPANVFSWAPQSPAAEAYRYLRARLDPPPLVASKEGGMVLLVAGARGLEGRTSVAANLATAFARGGDTVILVDADTRRPSLSRVFGARYEHGLGDLLAGRASLDEAAVPTEVPGLRLVAAAGDNAQTQDMLEVTRLEQVLVRMRAAADVIIIDSAPVLEVSDALTLARVSDLVVVVADPRRTRRGDASSVAQQIRAVGLGTIVGVLNGTPWSPWSRTLWRRTRPKFSPRPTPAPVAPAVPESMVTLLPPGGPNGQGENGPGEAKKTTDEQNGEGRPTARQQENGEGQPAARQQQNAGGQPAARQQQNGDRRPDTGRRTGNQRRSGHDDEAGE